MPKRFNYRNDDETMIQVTLTRMRNESYNGMQGRLVFCSTPRRVGVRLDDGSLISVRLECVLTDSTVEQCPICMDPIVETTGNLTSCGHNMHWWCLNEWRATAGRDFESSGARCPVCRSYVGIACMTSNIGQFLSKIPSREIVITALGAIHQDVARLNQDAEPSFDEELTAVMQQMAKFGASGNADNTYSSLRRQIDHYLHSPNELNRKQLVKALSHTLALHCFPCKQSLVRHYGNAIKNWIRTTGLE